MQLLALPVQRGGPIWASSSTFCTATPPSTARACAFAGTLTLPAPGATLQLPGVSSTLHGPPMSAAPPPPLTVRLKRSAATTPFPAETTVKLLLLVAVPAGVVTLIGPLLAPAGTVALIWVAELTV